MKQDNRRTNAEELRVHTVEVGDKEKCIRSRDVKEQQVAGRQIQNETASMNHQQIYQLHRKNQSERCAVQQDQSGSTNNNSQ